MKDILPNLLIVLIFCGMVSFLGWQATRGRIEHEKTIQAMVDKGFTPKEIATIYHQEVSGSIIKEMESDNKNNPNENGDK